MSSPAPVWLDDIVREFGRSAGLSDFALNDRGAAAVVSDEKICCDGVIPVKDADEASAKIYSNYYSDPAKGMKVAAVTGTNGKTSTVCTAAAILRATGASVGVIWMAAMPPRA